MMIDALLAFQVPGQVVLSGATRGLSIGLLAVGIILIYRSCRVINFALGELGALAAAFFVRLVVNWHWNFYLALVVSMAAGALLGALMELLLVRRLSRAPRVVLLVATIGAAQLLLFVQFLLPDIASYSAFPVAFTKKWDVGGVVLRADHVVALVVFPTIALVLAWFLNRSKTGVAIRASADNPDAARLAGISVKRMSTSVWTIVGGLAAVVAILGAPLAGANVGGTTDLGPGLLVRTLAAAVIASMMSMPRAVIAAVLLGIGESVLFYNNSADPGLIDAAQLVVILVAVLVVSMRSRDFGLRERFSFAPRVRPIPPRLEQLWVVRNHTRILAGLALLAAVLLPFLATSPSRQFLYSRVVLTALIALSLTVITGWSGQLSLGQFAFVGLGAMSTYALVQQRVALPAALALAVIITALAAVIVGAPALRMRGPFLAVTTLALAIAAPWLLGQGIFVDPDHPQPLLRRPVVGGVSLESQRTYYWVCLALLALSIVVVARVRRSGLGRSMLAVRDNEQAASAMGLSPTRVKMFAFALSGALAGLGGGALAGLLVQFSPSRFGAGESLTLVAVAVVGGLASITGTILGSIFVVGLPALLPGIPEISLITSGAGMLILVLYFPGGLVQVLFNLRDGLLAIVERRMAPAEGSADKPAATERPSAPSLPSRPRQGDETSEALVVEHVFVKYGLNSVVRDASLQVGRGEVVGLIGTNGAGKSTLMNAIGGFVPCRGKIAVLGTDVNGLSAHRRAMVGLGRTFQDAALFGDLTVRETVATAVESRGHVGFVSVALALPKARRLERAKQSQADEIIDFVGLGPYSQRFVSELSTGMRRIVELACLVATDAKMLCLDEPTAGIAQREAEAF
ncbi:MAG: ATP-binding cassette domain-containing protein, partial [Aquihabitans sp.]